MAYRVIRILEYIYDDADKMIDDRARWTETQVYPRMRITSTSLPPQAFLDVKPIQQDATDA